MSERGAVRQIGFWLPLVVAGIGLSICLFLLFTSPNLGDLAALFVVEPATGLILLGALLVFAARREWRDAGRVLIAGAAFGLCALCLQIRWVEIRAEGRWFFESGALKATVMAQPQASINGLRYTVWDGWGMFAMDTDVYLVYSPDDELRNYSAKYLAGLPCPVAKVYLLERHWYSVTFFTDTGWPQAGGSCS